MYVSYATYRLIGVKLVNMLFTFSLTHSIHGLSCSLCSVLCGTVESYENVLTLETRLTGINLIVIIT